MTPANVVKFVVDNFDSAAEAGVATGMHPLVILAHAGLEGGWGKSALARVHHNHFGYKTGANWKGKRILLTTTEYFKTPDQKGFPEIISIVHEPASNRYKYTVKDWFRAFDSADEGFLSYAKTMTTGRYKAVARLSDPVAFARGIAALGYHTSNADAYARQVQTAFGWAVDVVKKKGLRLVELEPLA